MNSTAGFLLETVGCDTPMVHVWVIFSSLICIYRMLCTHSTTGHECYFHTNSETCLCINMGSQMHCFWLGRIRLKWEVHCKASTMNTTPSPVSIIVLNVLWLVGDHMFCAKHAFVEMGDTHITFCHEYGLQVWFASIFTHVHARARYIELNFGS